MTLAVDASTVVAALIDTGDAGSWAESMLTSGPLAAPHLVPVEVANVLRRSASVGDISPDVAALAHGDLLALRVELFPYFPFAPRAWELRSNVTTYDAWYVALAESLGARLATLDVRLSRASGVRCQFATPPILRDRTAQVSGSRVRASTRSAERPPVAAVRAATASLWARTATVRRSIRTASRRPDTSRKAARASR